MVDAKTQAILDFLQSQAEAKPELLEMFTQMGDLYARKLWHQLTVLLESFFLLIFLVRLCGKEWGGRPEVF